MTQVITDVLLKVKHNDSIIFCRTNEWRLDSILYLLADFLIGELAVGILNAHQREYIIVRWIVCCNI